MAQHLAVDEVEGDLIVKAVTPEIQGLLAMSSAIAFPLAPNNACSKA